MARIQTGEIMKARVFIKYGGIALLLGVAGFTLAIGAMTLVFAPKTGAYAPTSSSDAASWIQAIGSILAIVGAFFVGKRQADDSRTLANETEKLRLRRRLAGMRTVVDTLLHTASVALDSIEEEQNVVKFELSWKPITLPDCHAALRAFEALPIHEFGSIRRIFVALDVERFIRQLIYDVTTAVECDEDRQTAYASFRGLALTTYLDQLDRLEDRLVDYWPNDSEAWEDVNGANCY